MLQLIARQPLSVTDVAKESRLSVSMSSRHLAMLAAAGLIVRERAGSCVMYRLTAAGIAALRTLPVHGDQPSSPAPVVAAPVRDDADLTDLDEDDAHFVLVHGMAAFAVGVCDRDRWLERLTRDLGGEWRSRLPTVWDAAARLFRGESLDGLPLPPGVVAAPPKPPILRRELRGQVPQRQAP